MNRRQIRVVAPARICQKRRVFRLIRCVSRPLGARAVRSRLPTGMRDRISGGGGARLRDRCRASAVTANP